jgi:pilus assembly protein CpaD
MCWSLRPTSAPRRSFNRDYFENQPIWNLGCVSQRNLAAMVDEPADLLQPRGETHAYPISPTCVTLKICTTF